MTSSKDPEEIAVLSLAIGTGIICLGLMTGLVFYNSHKSKLNKIREDIVKSRVLDTFFKCKPYHQKYIDLDGNGIGEDIYSCEGKNYTFSFNDNSYTVYEVSPLVKKVIE